MTETHHGARMLAVAVVAPAVILTAAMILLFRLAAVAPAVVATHWSLSGVPNGFSSPYTFITVMVAVVVTLIALIGGSSVVVGHRSDVTPMTKLLGVASIWATIVIASVSIGALAAQQTRESVATAQNPVWWLVGGVVGATAVAAGAWFLLPKSIPRSAAGGTPASVSPVTLAAGERVMWVKTAAPSNRIVLVLIGAILVVALVQLLILTTTSGRSWWISFAPIVLLVLVLSSLAWTIRIDVRGVRSRSVLGVPWMNIPLERIASASVTEIRPLADFGGYGYRIGAGRYGVILKSGPALAMRLQNGSEAIFTVDDAAGAAALINGLLERKARVD